jgi:hypothetical protein
MDKKEILKDIDELIKSLDKNLLGYRLIYGKFLNIIPGIPSPDKEKVLEFCVDLLDSIQYRVESVSYHLGYLRIINKGMTEQLIASFPSDDDLDKFLMMRGADIPRFFFDDIVFNLMSLFDYMGNLFWFSFSGKSGRCKQWGGVLEECEKAISGKGKVGNNESEDLMVCRLIIKYHKDLVKSLAKYRGKLIHFKKDPTKSQISTDFSHPEKSEFTVFAPEEFINEFEELVELSKERELTLVETAAWIIKKSLIVTNEILSLLQEKYKKI